jgi:hypothetical protein
MIFYALSKPQAKAAFWVAFFMIMLDNPFETIIISV